MGSEDRKRTGVCIIRAETLAQGCLYTVTFNPDVVRVSVDRQARYGAVDDVVEAVRRFLVSLSCTENGSTSASS